MDHDFGKRLARARDARGLGIEEAAHATRIRASHIRALEEGDLVKFPNAAYAKSFLLMYARFLGVDVSDIAAQIDTTTQMKVEDFQYLTNRAGEEKNQQRAASDSNYDFVVPQKSGGSWMPLIALAAIVAIGVIGFIVRSNFSRIADTVPKPAPAPAAAAVQPLGDVVPPKKLPEPKIEPPPPRPVVIALPPLPLPVMSRKFQRRDPFRPWQKSPPATPTHSPTSPHQRRPRPSHPHRWRKATHRKLSQTPSSSNRAKKPGSSSAQAPAASRSSRISFIRARSRCTSRQAAISSS